MTYVSPAYYQAAAIKAALKLYAKTGMRVNRAYTPTAMLRAATRITGKSFKRGDYMAAHNALDTWLKEQQP